MLSTTSPFLPPTILVASCSMFYCPNLWSRAVVWFYSSCCVSSQRWLYFGGGQSDLCVDSSSLYTRLLKFIKTCESHLRKGAINDRPTSSFFGTPVKNSKHSDLVTASKESKVGPSGHTVVLWWLWVLYLRIPPSLLWSSPVLLAWWLPQQNGTTWRGRRKPRHCCVGDPSASLVQVAVVWCRNTRLGAGSGVSPALCWELGAQRRGRSDRPCCTAVLCPTKFVSELSWDTSLHLSTMLPEQTVGMALPGKCPQKTVPGVGHGLWPLLPPGPFSYVH